MSKRGSRIPKKLKHDAIIEAIFEARFDTSTSPEFLLVRLSEFQPWKGFTQSRLPAYSIPETVRKVDPNLRYQPTFELTGPQGQRSVKIGPNVLSFHLRAPYNGWINFGEEVNKAAAVLFDKAENLTVSRLGLRYVNALTAEVHKIRGISDLDIKFQFGDSSLQDGININVMLNLRQDTSCTVRIATPQFVLGSLPVGATVWADIDVYTPEPFETKDLARVSQWTEDAHTLEKQEFFVLLTDQTIDALEEK